ncbi:hypothetical protein Aph02nite_15890 [Actinoplanes philippinensis]|uniref:Uncharacterized protein n=1 Tax=Actinoplanes philippinensis TaxID=35752 RepID=A0A1I2B0W2_9ACTN|nr:hypothetical protein Aph02nite_15890 [Actinoplanes philippinensis]SFE49831.1 hypothetical protein SAMN05421541_10254 [Actinoplanes philippinensis]
MRGLIRVFLAGLVVSGAVMTATPADAEPVRAGRTPSAPIAWGDLTKGA